LKTLCAVSVSVDRDGTDTRSMSALWKKLIQVPEFSSFGAHWRTQRPPGFDVDNADFFSRDRVAHENRVAELTDVCHTDRRGRSPLSAAGELMAVGFR
jgi:hypothetical protein